MERTGPDENVENILIVKIIGARNNNTKVLEVCQTKTRQIHEIVQSR